MARMAPLAMTLIALLLPTCAQAAAEWQGFVHGEGTGWKGQVELALPS